MICTDCVDTYCGWFTGTVKTLININTFIVGENIAWLTPTGGNMIGGRACSTTTAHHTASINTSVVRHLTHLITSAVTVLLTLNLCATKMGAWVANMLVKTLAERFMIANFTICICSTFSSVTRIDTFTIASSISSTGSPTSPLGQVHLKDPGMLAHFAEG